MQYGFDPMIVWGIKRIEIPRHDKNIVNSLGFTSGVSRLSIEYKLI